MKQLCFSTFVALGLLIAAAGCDGGGGGGGGSGGAGGGGGSALKWFTTCGDPVCNMATDDPALADCTTEKEGDACATSGATCEIAADDCNANLICAATDPKDQAGGCPISLASAKRDITYLTDAEREKIREDVVTMPLATWRYRREGGGAREHLGFIIDDQPPTSAAVRPSGERVDLYGYTSMAVAAIQAQDRQIRELRAEIDALRADLARERAGAAVCAPP